MNNIKLTSYSPHFGKGPDDLFTYNELEALLNLRPFVINKRFFIVNKKDYKWRTSNWCTDNNSWPISCIEDALKMSSAYLIDCSRVNKKINGFSETLEKIFKRPVDCHIYFSLYKNIESFGKHKDESHNVIVVQEGTINFKIYDGDNILEKNLSKGDYAFIPAQMYHHLTPLTDKRLSCSFPITTNNDFFFEERKWLKLPK